MTAIGIAVGVYHVDEFCVLSAEFGKCAVLEAGFGRIETGYPGDAHACILELFADLSCYLPAHAVANDMQVAPFRERLVYMVRHFIEETRNDMGYVGGGRS